MLKLESILPNKLNTFLFNQCVQSFPRGTTHFQPWLLEVKINTVNKVLAVWTKVL